LAALDLTEDDLLLDVGCGTGAASRAASAVARLVVGVDLSPEMIRRATELAGDVENVRFMVADAEQLPFDDGAFTAVVCSNSFHHYPDPSRAVREMARVLASDGKLVIGDACADLPAARIADAVLRRIEPGHVRLYRSRAGVLLATGGALPRDAPEALRWRVRDRAGDRGLNGALRGLARPHLPGPAG
jgi:ubiquinone/menaquinone biosynthesis C-methylase UbiE